MESDSPQPEFTRAKGTAKWLGRLAALLGLIAALWLVWRENPRMVFDMLRVAGPGLVLAALVHISAMLANAWDWRTLIVDPPRPSLAQMLKVVWIRESINCMLPVARVGGEVVSFRVLRRYGLSGATAAGSLVADIQLTLISQMLCTIASIGYLLSHSEVGAFRLAANLAWGVVVFAPLLLLFSLLHHASPFERMARLLNRVAGGHLTALIGHSAGVDQAIGSIWQRRGTVLRYLFIWQPVQTVATGMELYVAMHFLGGSMTVVQAVVFESLIQAVSSAAFFVPGALGVQEGGFVLIGAALGLDPPLCLALAGARRVRDLLIYIPGLLAWQHGEARSESTAAPTPEAATVTVSRTQHPSADRGARD
jgi:glycosyltransferase 2 family protein